MRGDGPPGLISSTLRSTLPVGVAWQLLHAGTHVHVTGKSM